MGRLLISKIPFSLAIERSNMKPLAEVNIRNGRHILLVAGIILAVEDEYNFNINKNEDEWTKESLESVARIINKGRYTY